jgi:hypothetical protein
MNKSRFLLFALLSFAISLSTLQLAVAQQASTNGVPAHLVVTVEPRHGSDVPAVSRDEVMVFEGKNRDTVMDWIPAQGDHAALELYLLIDDETDTNLGVQLDDLRKFITAQPATTKVGVAYMQDGMARIAANLSDDHAAAAKVVRLPMGVAGANSSPYFSLSDLIKHWPASKARREVVMVSDGIDRYYDNNDLQDPYLEAAIDDATRAGILVSAIYSPGAGHISHSYWQTYWGQLYLSALAEKTGGEAYYIGFNGQAVSFSPYLADVSKRLEHQYLLVFEASFPKKAEWRQVRLRTEVPNVDLVSAGRVWVSPEH